MLLTPHNSITKTKSLCDYFTQGGILQDGIHNMFNETLFCKFDKNYFLQRKNNLGNK